MGGEGGNIYSSGKIELVVLKANPPLPSNTSKVDLRRIGAPLSSQALQLPNQSLCMSSRIRQGCASGWRYLLDLLQAVRSPRVACTCIYDLL
jgi:hypothetical protein